MDIREPVIGPEPPSWVASLRARGLEDAALLALDVIEPFGPLGAQVLFAAGPTLRLFGLNAAASSLAQSLETPEGVDRLRDWLTSAPAEDGSSG